MKVLLVTINRLMEHLELVRETTKQDNKTKVYYGLLKEPDIQCILPAEEEDDTSGRDGDKPKKKKAKKDPLLSKKTKFDPNALPVGRMPLSNLKYADKVEKAEAIREIF